jgi:hypothetical protein
MEQLTFRQVVSRGCGLDVHQKAVVATIDGEGIKRVTREFGTFISSLTDLRDWLLDHGITYVAMESTGVYWKSVYHILNNSEAYKELGADYVNLRVETKRKSYLRKELEKLGYEVLLTDKKAG